MKRRIFWNPLHSVHYVQFNRFSHQSFAFTSLARKFKTIRVSSSGGSSTSDGNYFIVPGATVATILMFGALHARRMYNDKKMEEASVNGFEFEFQSDLKASFLGVLPLRTISRFWGLLTSVEVPVWLRPYAYKAWARAFHSNLEEAALPLDQYGSLRDFFVRALKEGSRSIDLDPKCLISPVDGTILRFGELKAFETKIEQVKGFSYSVSSLLGSNSFLQMMTEEHMHDESNTQKTEYSKFALRSSKVWDEELPRPLKGLFYCVIYLMPGDYHRVHSPVDWNVLVRRHFPGKLYPVNERATRTIRNLYVENERVVLEGWWKEGFMAIAAIGATNIGSIELFMESELKTNQAIKKVDERLYEPKGTGVALNKGQEMAAFNMGSTVVLVFQAPISSHGFSFCVQRGRKVHVGEALGRWS